MLWSGEFGGIKSVKLWDTDRRGTVIWGSNVFPLRKIILPTVNIFKKLIPLDEKCQLFDDCRLIHHREQEDPLQKEDFYCLKADKRNRQRICFLKIALFSPLSVSLHFQLCYLYLVGSHCVSIDVFVSWVQTKRKVCFQIKIILAVLLPQHWHFMFATCRNKEESLSLLPR